MESPVLLETQSARNWTINVYGEPEKNVTPQSERWSIYSDTIGNATVWYDRAANELRVRKYNLIEVFPGFSADNDYTPGQFRFWIPMAGIDSLSHAGVAAQAFDNYLFEKLHNVTWQFVAFWAEVLHKDKLITRTLRVSYPIVKTDTAFLTETINETGQEAVITANKISRYQPIGRCPEWVPVVEPRAIID